MHNVFVNKGGKMKRGIKITILGLLLISSFLLFAEEIEVNVIERSMEDLEESLDELDEALDEIDNVSTTYVYYPSNSNRVKMGVFLTDLSFQDAYEMHYDYNYGVMVTGVTNKGPAEEAGIMEGDIIMEVDGEKVRYEDHLVRLIKTKSEGQEGKVKFFRDEKVFETTLTFRKLVAEKKDIEITTSGKAKRKISVGHGGGSWYPIWYQPDLTEFNDILSEFGFKEETFSEDGFLIQGGGGMGHVGKGWFIGGMGAGYENNETTKHNWVHYKNGVLDTALVSRKVKYNVSFGGVTLDKRFPIFKNFIGSVGFMIGWGEQGFKLTQVDDNGSVGNLDFNAEMDLSDQFDQDYDYKSKLSMKQEFILFHPKATFLYEILDWLHLRTEVGYMVSHSPDGWSAKRNGEKIKVENAPDLNMDGLTVSIGPWFGF